MDRQLHIARLVRKECLSQSAQCFHLEFAIDAMQTFEFHPGQFVTVVAHDRLGKRHTRAYSIASAPIGNRFDLCLNRVAEGYLSNLLPDLSIGETVQIHGPHGLFTLREPITDSILVAAGTGVAPMRGFLQHLFPSDGPDRSTEKRFWLIYGADREGDLFYRDEFESFAARHANFRYLPTLSQGEESWAGNRGDLAGQATRIAAELSRQVGLTPIPAAAGVAPDPHFEVYAYVCGLNNMIIAVRERLKDLGWHRKQIIVERYD